MQGFSDPSPRIFTRSPGPELQRGRENRIVIYPGCFNPPHAGHAALLWHTYLNTDANTIAVMIFALSDDCLDFKDHVTDNKGKAFILSHYQRRELWKDEVLGRFAWVFPEDDDDRLDMFMATVKRLAKLGGFKVSFPTLYGGDHITQKSMANGLWGWDGRTCVSSDVTRPMDFVPEDGSGLLQLEECEKWKEMKNEGQEWTGKDNATPDCWPCWPCWPCAKMRKVFPEGVLKNGSFSFDIRASKHPLATILAHCHFTKNTLQWTRLTRKRGYIIFIPSNRNANPPSPTACPTISATAIRESLLKLEVATQQFRDEINYTVPNGALLCIYMGLDRLWKDNGTYEQLIGGKRCEDDLWLEKLRKKQAHEDGNKLRRRSSSL
ncbi:hypothetical protein J4E85_009760 [Alternaria conjuncta]|uniref:uncharacterized protein n=1 Tax=Alternaria conjuncta TaxID=181017 RepID=UPI002220C46A|nr:uncharacterized protein J4E85_009760 [Alternaria conjuncta]KAI4918970.1 hypothetical protein J4E85_009760 [Alternaria conjuncta]